MPLIESIGQHRPARVKENEQAGAGSQLQRLFDVVSRSGVVSRIEPRRLGRGILELGGGRRTIEDQIDHSVGFVLTVKPGDPVRGGEPIASVFARDESGIALGLAALSDAIVIGDEGRRTPLVSHRITAGGVESLA